MKNNWLVFLMMFLMFPMVHAQESSYQLSSHILDISTGKPAPNVKIVLQKRDAKNNWVLVEEKITDQPRTLPRSHHPIALRLLHVQRKLKIKKNFLKWWLRQAQPPIIPLHGA